MSVQSEDRIEVLAAVREAAGDHRHLGAARFACAEGGRRQVGQSRFVIDDEARSAAATTRSICSTSTCRPARAGGSRRSTKQAERPVLVRGTPVGNAGADDLLRLALPGLVRAARRGWGAKSLLSRPPSPFRPARRIGTCCCARGRSRPGCSSSPRRRPARHEDGRKTYGHSLVVDPWGEVLLDAGRAGRGRTSPRSTSGGSRRSDRAFRPCITAGRSRR